MTHPHILDLTSQCRAARVFDINAAPAPYPLPWHTRRTEHLSIRIVAANSAIVCDMFDWADDLGVAETAQAIVGRANGAAR